MGLYDIADYGVMIRDAGRLEAYRQALRRCIEPGATVLDIGTGTGILALLACRLGAARVYAIESSDAIQVARQAARDNGLDDRIVFFHDSSTRVVLPQLADVMVSDLRGILPLFGRHIPTIVDARRRLLRPGGAMIPRRDEIRVAPVEADELYRELVGPWGETPDDLDLSAARSLVTHSLHRRRVTPDQLLADAQLWAELDYATIEEADAGGRLEFTLARDGHMHGWTVWFDATLTDGVHLSNDPAATETVYGAIFLPLEAPLRVAAGDIVALELTAALIGGEYVWRWITEPEGAEGDGRRRLLQSSFHGMPLTPRTLALADAAGTPALSDEGRIDAEALAMIDGETPLGEIARRLSARHPEAFPDERAARERVALLARRYAE